MKTANEVAAELAQKLEWFGNERIEQADLNAITLALILYADERVKEAEEKANEELKANFKHWTDVARANALKEYDGILNKIPGNLAFAREEGVREGRIDGIAEGREQALEEAAKVADEKSIIWGSLSKPNIHAKALAEEIRALKESK